MRSAGAGRLSRLATHDAARLLPESSGLPQRNTPRSLVSRRDERGSIIVSSNRGLEASGEILGDAIVAATLIDRLVHHATMVMLTGRNEVMVGG